MNKNCPFCKKSIPADAWVCPHCRLNLVERIPKPKTFIFLKSIKNKLVPHGQKQHTHQASRPTKKWFTPSRIALASVAVIFIIILGIWSDDSTSSTSDAPPVAVQDVSFSDQPAPTAPQPTQSPVSHTPTPTYQAPVNGSNMFSDLPDAKPAAVTRVSLANGTALKSNSAYLQGDGTLTIDNGTNLDAEAKLVTNNQSIFTVYIKANDTYEIENISDGNYGLAFALGTNWDSTNQVFLSDKQYEQFEDPFDFTTQPDPDGQDTDYMTYSITLNPVVGGTAQTDNINQNEFNNY